MSNVSDFIATRIQTKRVVCDIHGEYEAKCYFGTIWTRCTACEKELREKEAAAAEEKDRAEKLARWNGRLGYSGIPDRFQNRTLDSYVASTVGQQKALKFATDYASNFESIAIGGKSAVFIGRPGTGKTHLAIGIGLHAMRTGHAVLFTTVMRAIRRVKDTWNKSHDESETDAIDALIYPALLILDEVGVQFGSETEKMILFDILNGRYEKRRPVILLSNLSLDEVKSYLGERVFDRLREDGGEVVSFDWESHRGRS